MLYQGVSWSLYRGTPPLQPIYNIPCYLRILVSSDNYFQILIFTNDSKIRYQFRIEVVKHSSQRNNSMKFDVVWEDARYIQHFSSAMTPAACTLSVPNEQRYIANKVWQSGNLRTYIQPATMWHELQARCGPSCVDFLPKHSPMTTLPFLLFLIQFTVVHSRCWTLRRMCHGSRLEQNLL